MRKLFSVLAYTAAFLSLSTARTEAQIQITTLPGSVTDAEELANALIGSPGVVLVSGSASFTGLNEGSGFFTGGEDFLPFNEGIVLTTGIANQLPGPNTGSGSSNPDLFNFQIVNGAITPGDQQLTQLVGPTSTYNAAVLQFSFIPSNDVVSFRYVFGSEEYNEFVGQNFNDIFAFFLNGTNIALIPGSQAPIRINSVNANSNSQFFTGNTLPGASLNTKLDGLIGVSQALYATGPVDAGQVNTIRIAVADVFDASFDSAVVIEAESFVDAPPPGCGNGFLEPGEACDDSNTLPGDGCSPTCTIEKGECGDGTVDPSEQCDPPDGVRCDSQCQTIPIVCGNGIVQPGEACDDSNTLPGDGCSATCTIEQGQCGDGTVDPSEQCDPPDGVRCDSQCQTIPIVCGNGIVQPGEACDDSNTLPGDGCSATCTIEQGQCGDGTVDPSEQCDPPDGVRCDSQCQTIPIVCGNGIVQPGEACDDSNTRPGDGCSATCTIEQGQCGDGTVDPPEQCDPPDGVRCDSQCQTIPIVCGNGIVQPGEECDDSNTLPGDGCSPACMIEAGECGNGTVDPPEQCDPPDGVRCDNRCRTIPIVCDTTKTRRKSDGSHRSGSSWPRERDEHGGTKFGNDDDRGGLRSAYRDREDEKDRDHRNECELEFCGDQTLQSGEQCDDGNTVSGDGCSPECRIEVTACGDFRCGRNRAKAEICHAPPGNEGNIHTLCIAPSAVPAHLRNHPGDHCGPC